MNGSISKEGVVDATGMRLVDRDGKGRFLYRVLGTGWRYHEIALTHEQRVNFAVLRRLVKSVRAGTELNPANLRQCHGRGSVGERYVWLPVDAPLSEETCRTIAHEFVHNDGLHHGSGGRGHYSKKWTEREAFWVVVLSKATAGWKKWPKVKGLRKPPVRKPRAVVAVQPETPEARWEKKRAHAEKMLAAWERKAKSAERRAKKWRAALRRAERRLAKPVAPVAIAAAPKAPEVRP